MYFSPAWLLLMVVSLVLGLVTQGYVKSTYRRWSKVPIATGQTGAQVARRILDADGLQQVDIVQIPGNLTDNYDPRVRKLSLSQDVYAGQSVASVGVAAHESGHALQHAHGYTWATVRTAIVPVANLGSSLSWILIIAGFWLNITGLINLGILFYAAAVVFTIVTLPVEFDASKRALAQLETVGGIPPEQVAGAKQVLTAAAMTYVAAALIAALQLLYYLLLARDR
jgi:uncharacterized protein